MKIWRTWPSTVFGLTTSSVADALVGVALGHQREHLALALGELVERPLRAPRAHQPRHDRRVDHALALVDPAQRVDQHREVGHALLEQVADALGRVLEQPQRVARLEVVGEHEHADVGVLAADLLRGDEPVVGVAGRHADVEDRHVRPRQRDAAQRLGRRARLADDFDVGLGQQPREPFAQQRLVVGEHYAHGSSATRPLAVHAQHAAEGADAVVEVDQLRPGRHGGVDRHAQPAVLARGADGGVAARGAPPR